MTSIAIDGLNEEDFRREIEGDLRHGRDKAAIERLRRLLEPHAGPGKLLPERFLTISAEDLSLRGWEYLGDCIARHDRPGRPVTAISIGFSWAGEDAPEVDDQGRLHPSIETGYFNDAAYPFSQSGRDDLLDGYSLHGCNWAADCEASDNALSLDGVDDLHGALAMLEAVLLASEEPDPEEICAGSLGACLLSTLLFQAVGQRIAKDGLPRPLCVTAGSNGVYPYFDAPVVGMPEKVRRAAAEAEEAETEAEANAGVPVPRYSSLLMTGIPRAQKRAVLVLAETENEMAVRIARLRGHGESAGSGDCEAPAPLEEHALPTSPAPLQEAAEVDPVPNILMAKKPVSPEWDFRDLLSPLPTRSTPAVSQPEPDGDMPIEATVEAKVATVFPAETVDGPDLEPGFPLLEESLDDRLGSLLAPQGPIMATPADIPIESVMPQPWPAEQAGPVWPFGINWDGEQAGPVWPFGINWDGEQAAQPEPEPAPISTAAPSGLWSRLRAWIRPRG